jgi:hypothetical protein
MKDYLMLQRKKFTISMGVWDCILPRPLEKKMSNSTLCYHHGGVRHYAGFVALLLDATSAVVVYAVATVVVGNVPLKFQKKM